MRTCLQWSYSIYFASATYFIKIRKGLIQIKYDYKRKEGNVIFKDTLNTFYVWLYGVRHMVKDHSDSGRGYLLPSHGLFFPISSNVSFI